MTRYTVTQLDRRHNGHLKFKYSVSPVTRDRSFVQRMEDFQLIREWAWATYGPSCERDWAIGIAHENRTEVVWAWDTEHANKRLYLRGDAELTLFRLKFG